MYDALETAIEADEDAKRAILTVDPTSKSKPALDSAYNALRTAIEELRQILEPVET